MLKTQIGFRSNLWKIYLFEFLTQFNLVSGVLVPFFTDWGNITFTQVMILQSWFMFWIFILEIPTGAFADYIGRKQSLALATLFNIVAVFIYGSIPNFYIFLLGEFLWAISLFPSLFVMTCQVFQSPYRILQL